MTATRSREISEAKPGRTGSNTEYLDASPVLRDTTSEHNPSNLFTIIDCRYGPQFVFTGTAVLSVNILPRFVQR